MKVTITEGCNRCKREVPKEIDSSEIPALEKAAETRAAKCDEVVEHLKGLENAPDLVVMFKGEVRTIDRICDAYCAGTVKNNLDIIFKEIDPSKRKPRTKKDAKDAKDGANGKDAKDADKKGGKSAVKDKTAQQAASK